MRGMSGSGFDDGPDGNGKATWTMETLPMAVRRELLERELKKLGFRRRDVQSGFAHDAAQAQQQASASHPQADSQPAADRHGD